jgi:hypothetical protein
MILLHFRKSGLRRVWASMGQSSYQGRHVLPRPRRPASACDAACCLAVGPEGISVFPACLDTDDLPSTSPRPPLPALDLPSTSPPSSRSPRMNRFSRKANQSAGRATEARLFQGLGCFRMSFEVTWRLSQCGADLLGALPYRHPPLTPRP